jgi:hypothetical protein
MKKLLAAAVFAGLVFADFAALSVTTAGEAQAAVCGRGAFRAGCVGRHGAVVVHRRPYYRPYRHVHVYRRW